MTDQHTVVAGLVEDTPGLVGNGDIADGVARLKGELRDDGDCLVWREAREWVFGLGCSAFKRHV